MVSSRIITIMLALAVSSFAVPLNRTNLESDSPPHFEVTFFSDQNCQNMIGAGGGAQATGCEAVGGGGAESFSFEGGGRFGISLWAGTGCTNYMYSARGSVDCSLAGFRMQSWQVRGAL